MNQDRIAPPQSPFEVLKCRVRIPRLTVENCQLDRRGAISGLLQIIQAVPQNRYTPALVVDPF